VKEIINFVMYLVYQPVYPIRYVKGAESWL
jgi:hypothetical protein